MSLEDMMLNGAVGNLPLAAAMVYAFNRIEQKLDLLIAAWRNWPPPKGASA